jgi:prolipoprotein diacylglyceryl transferase
MVHATAALPQYIPSPPISGFHLGPLLVHFYALGYIIGITLAVLITRRRWRAMGGDPDVVNDLALWVVPAGIIGGRIYFDITTPQDIPHEWYGPFAVWTGGLGIWGGVALATLVGAWRLRKQGLTVGPFANAIAPALLVAQAVGRVGNYFNKELFGKPTSLPWALQVPPDYRPAGFTQFATFQPTFLYELIWDLALAAFLVWLGHHAKIKNWSLFALYVAGYSAFRIFEESVRIDSSEHFLGLRLNMYIAILGTVGGLAWFVLAQRRANRESVVKVPRPAPDTPAAAALDEATEATAEGAGHAEADEPDAATPDMASTPQDTAEEAIAAKGNADASEQPQASEPS